VGHVPPSPYPGYCQDCQRRPRQVHGGELGMKRYTRPMPSHVAVPSRRHRTWPWSGPTTTIIKDAVSDYCGQITIEAVDADGARRLQAVRERRTLSSNCNTRQHLHSPIAVLLEQQAVQRASRRSPHLSCTPGTRHGIDAAMQSCNHPRAYPAIAWQGHVLITVPNCPTLMVPS
jgi:hypothetical protein